MVFDKLKKAGEKLATGVSEAIDEVTDSDCDWKKTANGYVSECGDSWMGDPRDTFRFCPFCGKAIEWEDEE